MDFEDWVKDPTRRQRKYIPYISAHSYIPCDIDHEHEDGTKISIDKQNKNKTKQ